MEERVSFQGQLWYCYILGSYIGCNILGNTMLDIFLPFIHFLNSILSQLSIGSSLESYGG